MGGRFVVSVRRLLFNTHTIVCIMFLNKFITFATVAASAVSVGFASPTAVAHGAVATAHAAAAAPDAAVRIIF